MAELHQGDRLQPSLLDRLTDDYPENKKAAVLKKSVDADESETGESQRARAREDANHRQVISARQLREYVKRDLAWLLNTVCLEDVVDLSELPLVADSVLNYGMADLTGVAVANTNTRMLEKRLLKIIHRYEPRIIKKSLRITVTSNDQMSRNALNFEIECDVWGQPAPERLYLKSEINLEDGAINFMEGGS